MKVKAEIFKAKLSDMTYAKVNGEFMYWSVARGKWVQIFSQRCGNIVYEFARKNGDVMNGWVKGEI